jgi:hypothetical protein
MRLDPFALPVNSSGAIGLANYTLKRYAEALRWFRETALRLPNMQAIFGLRPPMRSSDN